MAGQGTSLNLPSRGWTALRRVRRLCGSYSLRVSAICLTTVMVTSGCRQDEDGGKESGSIPTPSPLAIRLNAAGEDVQREAMFYLVSLGVVERRGGRTLLVLRGSGEKRPGNAWTEGKGGAVTP